MFWPYLKIWDWELIFSRAVKAISSPGVRSPCLWLCNQADEHNLFNMQRPSSFKTRKLCSFRIIINKKYCWPRPESRIHRSKISAFFFSKQECCSFLKTARTTNRVKTWTPALCVEMGFYADISWESRCNIEINVWAHFYKILLVFEVSYQPRVK